MRGSKINSDKKAKVIEEKLNNPDKSLRSIEKETGVNYSTAGKIIKKELPKLATQSEHIAKLIDDNQEILNITGNEIVKRLVDEEGKIRFDDLIKAKDLAFKQNHLIEQAGKGKEEDKTPIIISF